VSRHLYNRIGLYDVSTKKADPDRRVLLSPTRANESISQNRLGVEPLSPGIFLLRRFVCGRCPQFADTSRQLIAEPTVAGTVPPGKWPVPGFSNKGEIENEFIVLGRSAAAAGCSETFIESSSVAALAKVISFILGRRMVGEQPIDQRHGPWQSCLFLVR